MKIIQNINLMKKILGGSQSALKILFYIKKPQHHIEGNVIPIWFQFQLVDELNTFKYSQQLDTKIPSFFF